MEQLNTLIQSIRRELRFDVDTSSGQVIIRVIDAKTQALVRQIPSDEVLILMENMENASKGVLMNTTA